MRIVTRGRGVDASAYEKILEISRQVGVLRPRDLDAHGLPREYLIRLYRKGRLHRVGRGLYVAVDADPTEHHTLAQVCKRVPAGVVCLLSALQFHGITTQMPHQVWLALNRKARTPSAPNLPIRVVRFSGLAYSEGVELHDVEGVEVKVYNLAKTVADCFKFRNKIGLEVAMEALRECRRHGLCSFDELWKYAKVCRQTVVMRPYLEALA